MCPHLYIRLQPAGHIIGSAYLECHLKNLGKQESILFSGDLGAPYAPLLPAPKPAYGADLVVLESTYGDRLHKDRKLRKTKLKKAIELALQDRGVILIPAFSIGRTQEVFYAIEDLIHHIQQSFAARDLPWQELEIILDSLLASRVTTLYRQLQLCWDAEARGKLKRGRIIHYLKATISAPRTDILFSGYQAIGTPGRAIQLYGPQGGYVVLDGKRYDTRARIHSIFGYSAHADQQNLVNFIKRKRKRPKHVRLVYGEPDAQQALRRKLAELATPIID